MKNVYFQCCFYHHFYEERVIPVLFLSSFISRTCIYSAVFVIISLDIIRIGHYKFAKIIAETFVENIGPFNIHEKHFI